MIVFAHPGPDLEDAAVLAEIHAIRAELADVLRTPRRWLGGWRRTMLARAIQGSNSIEGYQVEVDDAAAALDDEEPLSADERTFAEIRGYRQALGYVLAMAGDPHFRLDVAAVRSMHFMMLSHELTKSPGQYRTGPIYVTGPDDSTVYQGPDSELVPDLVAELVASLRGSDSPHSSAPAPDADDPDPMIKASLAHLNLVMIHPFRDGNGRMARALQTLVLARSGLAEPAFSSIEEWLGSNTDDYYRVLALTGGGSWQPERDTSLWVKFTLRAHHMQAQTVRRRFTDAVATWELLDDLITRYDLPERVAAELFDASIGFRIRRGSYVQHAGIEERTASRDLSRLVHLDLLRPLGETRGRHYIAGRELRSLLSQALAERPAMTDPFPWMKSRLVAAGNS
jgi:Fic family protein